MWRLVAALVAGCGFSISSAPDASSGDPADAGDDAIGDARPDAAVPTWTVIETLVIDTGNASPTLSQRTLQAGVVYRLRVSGVITNVIDAYQGDADYYDFNNPKDNGCCEDIGLGIDDLVVNDLDTRPNWGPYDPTHVYEVDWTGQGMTITALFQDTYYGNNIGNLTLEILAFQ